MFLGSCYKTTCFIHSTHRANGLDNKLSPGSVLIDWAIDDMIQRGTTCIDYGYGSPKRDLSKHCLIQDRAMVLLLRKTLFNRALCAGHRLYRHLIARYYEWASRKNRPVAQPTADSD